jgi:hypothetical protein
MMIQAMKQVLVLVSGLLICIPLAGADWKKVAGEWDAYHLNEQQRAWFRSVQAQSGVPCCSIADGHPTAMDHRKDGYYIPDPRNSNGSEWLKVPDEALTKQKVNPVGVPVVWYVIHPGESPEVFIRCFVPESEG